ncbi:uncharacterized protein LOC121739709 [Aricia agestis]|uniref:uncharacterized protein LOC121739709 n=1 Tax=Aricia agestis TaxID=91739 RepID=UPI001C209F60|nr:uncharacterized protein LOC121739709 [Aricia agestis]
MWEEITQTLNSHGDGAIKDWKGWCKYWNDYKSKLKKMTAALRVSQQRTGGGPSQVREMNEIEKKILNLLGEDFGQGVPGARVEPFEEVTEVGITDAEMSETPLIIITQAVESSEVSQSTLMPEPVPGPSSTIMPPPNDAPGPEGTAHATGAAQAEESPSAGAPQTPPRGSPTARRERTTHPPPENLLPPPPEGACGATYDAASSSAFACANVK